MAKEECIKFNMGVSVRIAEGEGDEAFRRVSEGGGEVLSLADIPEWGGEVPPWLLARGVVEIADAPAKPRRGKAKAAEIPPDEGD